MHTPPDHLLPANPSMTSARTLRRILAWPALLAVAVLLTACGGRRHDEDDKKTQAGQARIGELRHAPGVTPFAVSLSFNLRNYQDLASLAWSVTPRANTFSKPVAFTYEKSWLDRRAAWQASSGRLEVPVFGLYAPYPNSVALTATFRDGSKHEFRAAIDTQAYTGPASLYASPAVNVARNAERVPGLDFVMIKNGLNSPVVIDTDGHMRWTGAPLDNAFSSLYADGGFYVGSQTSPLLHRMDVSGIYSSVPLNLPGVTNFHHDIAPGKVGMLAELETIENGVARIESVLAEIDVHGNVLRTWDLGRIFEATMRAHGDDPSNFVRDGADWFHMNSAIYDARDNALLISSRENFVVKLDYDTGAIRWLFGDTAKHWYASYPSLRKLALRLTAGKVPIGQHSLSLTPDGQLLLFNNGLGSLNQPPTAPRGATRTYSTPSRYAIDEGAGSAREVWTYERERELYSDICSSVYEGTPGNYLMAYSVLNARTTARLVGVDTSGKVAFDFAYPTSVCDTVFIAQPLAWSGVTLR